jgi:hypothetical protein
MVVTGVDDTENVLLIIEVILASVMPLTVSGLVAYLMVFDSTRSEPKGDVTSNDHLAVITLFTFKLAVVFDGETPKESSVS